MFPIICYFKSKNYLKGLILIMNIILKYLITFFLAMCPIIEIRGAIPVGVGLGLSYFESFVVGFFGNIIPIYFIVKYAGPIFEVLGKIKLFKKIIDFASERATKKIEENKRLQTFTALGLYLFVAVPLPGTGIWVGSLIANFLHVPPKKAVPPLILGVLTAGAIVLIATGSVVTIFQHIS